MAKEKLVVVGGDAAGMSAASQARRRSKDMEIVVFERSPHTSYAACGIPYFAADLVKEPAKLVARAPEVFRNKMNIDARVRHEVTAIDLEKGSVDFVDLESGNESSEPYDKLLIATGASPIVPNLPGVDLPGVHSISTLQSGIACREEIDRIKPRNAVVVGGGYIGIEMAEALLMRGARVTLVEMAPQVMLTLDPDPAARVADRMRKDGIELLLNEPLKAIEAGANGRAAAVITGQNTIPADIVILAIGIRPESRLAEQCGLPLGDRGAIEINARMETPRENVWAAGDCAQCHHLVSNRPFWIALGTVANKHGRIAGINISGGNEEFPGVVGTAITKFNDLEISRTGLSKRELEELTIDYVSATIDSSTRAHYYPGHAPINVTLHAERSSGKLLGVQIVGGPGSGKRIDAAAVALHARLTVADMLHLDLAYAPPFSPVWDPVQIAARVLEAKI